MTTAKPAAAPWKTPLALVVLLALLLALTFSGQWPGVHGKLSSSPKGLLAVAPNEVDRIDIRSGAGSVAMRRGPDGWVIEGLNGALPAELLSHIDTALRFLKVSEPSREIAAGELTAESFAGFGLAPSSEVAVLTTRSDVVTTVNFGTANPAGTSHYVRLGGAPTVYLMPRHVTEEWRLLFDMALRLHGKVSSANASRGAGLLLPVSMAQLWAIEIVSSGKLNRFERDAAGAWFRHTGQHTHTAGSDAHVADPVQAMIIESAFSALDAAVAEAHVAAADARHLAQYGLAFPTLIALLYARDSSAPVARLEFGAAADRLDRYARLAPDGAIITVAEFEPRRLIDLLKAVGAGS